MTYCAKCGAALSDGTAFCSSCGTHVPGSPALGSAPVGAGLTPNIAGALAYLGGLITGIIFLVIQPWSKNSFVRFHAFQSIFLSIAYIVFFAVWSAIFGTMYYGGFGFIWSFAALILTLARLAFFLLWLFLMFKAYQNERFSLPVIGPLAAKQAG